MCSNIRRDSKRNLISTLSFDKLASTVEYPALLGSPTLQEVSRMEARWI